MKALTNLLMISAMTVAMALPFALLANELSTTQAAVYQIIK